MRPLEWLLRIENLWLIPLAGLIVIYLLPSLYGMYYFSTNTATELTGIITVGVGCYVLFYWLFARNLSDIHWLGRFRWSGFDANTFIVTVIVIYFGFFLYAAVTAQSLALWEALNGADAQTIALARESLFKARTGWERSLVYINLMLTSAVVPYALALAFLKKWRYRYLFLVAFIVALMIPLEKSGVVKAFIPLIILALSGFAPRRDGYIFLISMVAIIVGVTSLTKMGAIVAVNGLEVAQLERQLVKEQKGGLSGSVQQMKKITNRFQVVDTSSPIGFVVNRALWIPYVTAYDWLLYFHKKMGSRYLLGSNNLTLSILTNQKRFNMDNAVFVFEFGPSSTGTSNTLFLVDAFVNFGWFGVILTSLIVAFLVCVVMRLNNPAAQACFYFYVLQLLVGSLFSVLFGGGLLLFMLMAILFNPVALKQCDKNMAKG